MLALKAVLCLQLAFTALQSLFVDVDHPEGSCFICLSFVLHSEDHDFVARIAVALFFRHFQNQRDQMLHVLLYMREVKLR